MVQQELVRPSSKLECIVCVKEDLSKMSKMIVHVKQRTVSRTRLNHTSFCCSQNFSIRSKPMVNLLRDWWRISDDVAMPMMNTSGMRWRYSLVGGLSGIPGK